MIQLSLTDIFLIALLWLNSFVAFVFIYSKLSSRNRSTTQKVKVEKKKQNRYRSKSDIQKDDFYTNLFSRNEEVKNND